MESGCKEIRGEWRFINLLILKRDLWKDMPDIRTKRRCFRIYFTEVKAAGGLVRHSCGKYLFIERKGKLDLPKGHIESGEDPETCAIREVHEECGITGHRIIKFLDSSYHTYTCQGISYLKNTRWYLMEYSGTMNLKPQIEEGITMIKWLSPEELSWIKANAWLSLIDLINTSILKNLPLP
jgi:8-oxo-dGTP pyrophosphatase MutT (NUDIX family)